MRKCRVSLAARVDEVVSISMDYLRAYDVLRRSIQNRSVFFIIPPHPALEPTSAMHLKLGPESLRPSESAWCNCGFSLVLINNYNWELSFYF